MLQLTGHAMHLHFFPTESVRICLPTPSGSSTEPEIVLSGNVSHATDTTLSIVLRDPLPHRSDVFPFYGCFTLIKSTSLGILEFEASGDLQWVDGKLLLEVKMLGEHRSIQRRAFSRIALRAEVRYRELAASSSCEWKSAELHDISAGGVSLVLRDGALNVGQELLISFALDSGIFSESAVVRRIDVGKKVQRHLFYGLEFLNTDEVQRGYITGAIARVLVPEAFALLNA